MSKPLLKEALFSIGLMSGTSMDGIDAALIETDGLGKIKELGHCSLHYDPLFKIALKVAEISVRKAKGNLKIATQNYLTHFNDYLKNELKQDHPEKITQDLTQYLQADISLQQVIRHSTQLHIKVVKQLLKETKLSTQQIDVIGYHGQTLLHRPEQGISVIVGDGKVLADELGIPVINDFRSNDMAHGGHGAPFAPLYHLALATRDQLIPAAVINCGGIANITLMSDENPENLLAFDTGAGNGLIDALVRQRSAGKEHMDKNGHYGQKGKVDEAVLKKLFEKSIIKNNHNYFSLKPPKSLDIGDLQLIPDLDHLSLEDACRTLEAFTAESLVQSLELIDMTPPKRWILAGGGWNNPVILQELQARLTQRFGRDLKIQTAQEVAWNGQALEAQIFAYLAVRSLKELPLSMPKTTGVKQPVSGGQVYAPLAS